MLRAYVFGCYKLSYRDDPASLFPVVTVLVGGNYCLPSCGGAPLLNDSQL